MSNYLKDGTVLPYPKSNRNAVPSTADPTRYVSGDEWNIVCAALDDVRNGLTLTNVEIFRSGTMTDAQVIQAAFDTGLPLSFPKRTYTFSAGETAINTLCHYMFCNDTTFKLANGAIVNTDVAHTQHTALMRMAGVQGFMLAGRYYLDGNRANQTYPATVSDFGRGTATLTSAGRRTNGIIEFTCASDNATPARHIRIVGGEVHDAYLNGLVFWQTEDVIVSNLYTHDNTINGISLGGVKHFTALGCHHFRDGASTQLLTSATPTGFGDRAGIQCREMPNAFTAAALSMPCIPVPVAVTDEPNYNVNIVDCTADQCGVESWFIRSCFPGRLVNCHSKDVGYQRLTGAWFNPAHYWAEWGYYEVDSCTALQSTLNTSSGWMLPDGIVLQTFEGNGLTASAPMNVGGNFRSSLRGFRAYCGNNAAGAAQQNFYRGARIYSACTATDTALEGVTAEHIRIENDTNWNVLPPHDVRLVNTSLRNGVSAVALQYNVFSSGSVSGAADGLSIDGLSVRSMSTTLSGTDDHSLIDFASNFSGFLTNGFSSKGLDLDGSNGGSGSVYNGIRLRQSEQTENMVVEFARCFNCFNPVRVNSFQGLAVRGQIDTAHRILVLDLGTATVDAGELRVRVATTGITDELFSLLNCQTHAIGVFRLEEGCNFGGAMLARTFASNAAPNGNITTTADSFFVQARKFFWRDEVNNYGSNSPSTLIYDMRRTFSGAGTLASATPYYAGELVVREDNSVWVGLSNRTAGAWAQVEGNS